MPIPLIQPLITEKNKLEQTQPWLLCLDLVNAAGDLTVRLVNNNENITYLGNVYIAFPFEIDSIPEVTKGSLPTLAIKVSNVDRQIQAYINQDATYGSGWDVTLSLVHASQLNGTVEDGKVAEIVQTWKSLDVTATAEFCTINLGMANPMLIQFPSQKFSGGFCQRTFNDGVGCPYAGSVQQLAYMYYATQLSGNYVEFSSGLTATLTQSSKNTDTVGTFEPFTVMSLQGNGIVFNAPNNVSQPNNQYLQIRFGVPQLLGAFSLRYSTDIISTAGYTKYADGKVVQVQGSNDNITYTVLGTYDMTLNEYNEFSVIGEYSYYRFVHPVTSQSLQAGANRTCIRSLQLYSITNTTYTSCNKTLEDCKKRFSTSRVNSDNESIGLPYLAFNGMEVRAIYDS